MGEISAELLEACRCSTQVAFTAIVVNNYNKYFRNNKQVAFYYKVLDYLFKVVCSA